MDPENTIKLKGDNDLTRSASNLCPKPSSNLSPSPSTRRPRLNLAFYHALKVGNLHPTFSDIKRYLVEVGQIVHDDDEVKKLVSRVEEKGWQELPAYTYELDHSLPPGTGHKYFVSLDKNVQMFPPTKDTQEGVPESGSSMMFPTAKDATPKAKRLKTCTNKPNDVPVSVRALVEHAYFKALWTHRIEHPAVSDIKETLEFIRKRGLDVFSVPDDEEIENILAHIRATYVGLEQRQRKPDPGH